MANIKSQIKRIRTAERQREENKGVRSELKTRLKKFQEALASGDFEAAEKARRLAARKLDKAVSAGVIHANKAANHKSAMAVSLAKAIANPPVKEEPKKPGAKRAAAKAAAKGTAKKAAAKTAEAAAPAEKKRAAKPAAKPKAAKPKTAAPKKAPAKKTAKDAAKTEEPAES